MIDHKIDETAPGDELSTGETFFPGHSECLQLSRPGNKW